MANIAAEMEAAIAAMTGVTKTKKNSTDSHTSFPSKKKKFVGGICRFCGGTLKNTKATAHRRCKDAISTESTAPNNTKKYCSQSKKNTPFHKLTVWKVLPSSLSTIKDIWSPTIVPPTFSRNMNTILRKKISNDSYYSSNPQLELLRRDCLKTLRGTVERFCTDTLPVKRNMQQKNTSTSSKSAFQSFEMWHSCRLLNDNKNQRRSFLIPSGDIDTMAMRRLQNQLKSSGMKFAQSRRIQPILNKASKRVEQVLQRRREQLRPNKKKTVSIKIVNGDDSKHINLCYKTTNLQLNVAHFEKLCGMWHMIKHGNEYGYSQRKQKYYEILPSLSSEFLVDLFCLIQRYASLMGYFTQGAGFQAAIHIECFDVLRRHLNVRFECFASPLNARYLHFCSAFEDTDGVFGSIGSFFNLTPEILLSSITSMISMNDYSERAKLLSEGISMEANPPFVPEVINAMAKQIDQLLSSLSSPEENKNMMNDVKYYSNSKYIPLSFVVIIPTWKDCSGHESMANSIYLRGQITLDQKKHGYCEGAQHIRGIDSFRVATQSTSVFILQNNAGAIKWPVTKKMLDELEKAFETKHNKHSVHTGKKRNTIEEFKKRKKHKANQ